MYTKYGEQDKSVENRPKCLAVRSLIPHPCMYLYLIYSWASYNQIKGNKTNEVLRYNLYKNSWYVNYSKYPFVSLPPIFGSLKDSDVDGVSRGGENGQEDGGKGGGVSRKKRMKKFEQSNGIPVIIIIIIIICWNNSNVWLQRHVCNLQDIIAFKGTPH